MIRCLSCSSEISENSRFCSFRGPALTARENRDSPELIDTQALPSAPSSNLSLKSLHSSHHLRTGTLEEGRFRPGQVIGGRYRIMNLIGRGGMGEVYRATDLKLGQPVALKFLPDAVAADELVLARFHNEVRIARQVS